MWKRLRKHNDKLISMGMDEILCVEQSRSQSIMGTLLYISIVSLETSLWQCDRNYFEIDSSKLN